jgi:hypothetical protein
MKDNDFLIVIDEVRHRLLACCPNCAGQRAYGGLPRDAIIDKVYRKHSRPAFPAGVPPLYSALSIQCWDQDYLRRPSFDVILARLHEMQSVFKANKGAFGGSGGP